MMDKKRTGIIKNCLRRIVFIVSGSLFVILFIVLLILYMVIGGICGLTDFALKKLKN